jgi:HK97 family phage portal protein
MARKKRVKGDKRPTDLASIESTAKKLQSLLVQPEWQGFMRGGYAKGIREKLLKIDYNTIRNLVDKVPLLNAIINVRVEQVKAFAKYVKPKEPGTGYEFYPADPRITPTKKDQDIFFQLANFLDQTGVEYDSQREDDFSDYLEMVTRETLTIDQIATELQRNRKGEVIAFWLLDGATIKRINPEEYNNENAEFHVTKDTRFCQIVDQKITNIFTDEDILFDYKNKRADIRFRGFGYSPVEQAVDIITTLLFGYTYARDQLMRDRVPKGFIQVMGDVGAEQLDAIREYWYSAMSGAGGQWNIPIVPSGKDGVGIDWKNIQASNRDMEYHKLMMFISSIIAAVFNIDLAELGIKADDSTALIGESSESRVRNSKDRGLTGLLSFVEQHINKILRKVLQDYKFRFTGLERQDETELAALRKQEVETRMTINELREEDGLEPLEDSYADVVLNPQSVQIYLADKAAEQQQAMGDQGQGTDGFDPNADPEAEFGGDGQDTGEDQGPEVDWQDAFQKSLNSGKKTIRVVIE